MPTVFINYRREESAGEARALFNDLVTHLGEDAVFMDVDSIAPGEDFRDVVHNRVATCDVMLSLVGKEWLTVTSRSGARRLDEPGDFVRLEIEAALKRKIPVAPVLLHGAEMPPADSLPDALRDFAFRNAFELSHTRWESDVEEMLRRLRLLTPAQHAGGPSAHPAAHDAPPVAAARSNAALLAIALIAVFALSAGAYLYFTRSAPAVGPATTSAAATVPDVARRPGDGSTAKPTVPVLPSAEASTPTNTVGPPLGVPVALGNQMAGPDSCLERLVISPCANLPAQRWRFEGAGDGVLRIHNAGAGMGMCLDLVKDGNNLVPAFAPCGQVSGQRWGAMPAGPAARFYQLRNESTAPDQCLALNRRPDGTLLMRMVNCAGMTGQHWRITPK